MTDFLLSDDAAQDLQDIYRQGLDWFGERQADSYLEDLFDLFDLLACNPYMGTIFDVQAVPFHRYSHKAHVLIYQVIKTKSELPQAGVKILRVFYGKSDYFGQI